MVKGILKCLSLFFKADQSLKVYHLTLCLWKMEKIKCQNIFKTKTLY